VAVRPRTKRQVVAHEDTDSQRGGGGGSAAPAQVAWRCAVRLLAARDRSTHEIRTRLDAFGAAPEIIAATVSRLQERHYLDDERFARTVAENAVRRGHGSERVRFELAAKGVAEPLVDAAIAAAFADESTLARAVLTRRFPIPPCAARERAKAARFLLQRGFPEAMVLAILGEG
jgi:regulatory protein